MQQELQDVSGITMIQPEATYLIWLDCRELKLSQKDLMRFFKEEAKIILNDGATFGTEGVGFVRMNIACPRVRLQKAMEQLKNALN